MRPNHWHFLLFIALILLGCNLSAPEPIATCSDGIWNQDEEATDCGGICTACPSCVDGIQNQGEEDIDCGGPCTLVCLGTPPCTPDTNTFTVNGLPTIAISNYSHRLDMNGDHEYTLSGTPGSGLVLVTISKTYNFMTSGMFDVVQFLDYSGSGRHEIAIQVQTTLVYYLVQAQAYVRMENGLFSITVCAAPTVNQFFNLTSDGHLYFPAIH